MNTSVDNYFINGCGRCPLGSTPDCKVHQWTESLLLLREIVSAVNLKEECKWGVPCYTLDGKNVLTITALKSYCAISFFKGSLLKDEKKILVSPGPNSRHARLIKVSEPGFIVKHEQSIRDLIAEAIEVEKSGLKVPKSDKPEPIPNELSELFRKDPSLKNAFDSLTPGRQRGYILYFSAPKQSATKISRIQKCIPKILAGEGLHDKYSGSRS